MDRENERIIGRHTVLYSNIYQLFSRIFSHMIILSPVSRAGDCQSMDHENGPRITKTGAILLCTPIIKENIQPYSMSMDHENISWAPYYFNPTMSQLFRRIFSHIQIHFVGYPIMCQLFIIIFSYTS